MDTPDTPSNARGGRLFVFREGASPIHEDDLTADQRATAGLPALTPTNDSPHDSPHDTEEVGSDG